LKVIQCDNVSKAYKRFNALKDLNFSIEENTITGLIGRNGAGKTTLLKLLSGFLRPTGGEIKVFDENPFNNLTVSSNTIFIDENMSFSKQLTLDEILCAAKNFYPNFDETMSRKLLEYFSINKSRNHSELSKGMTSTFNMILGIASHCSLTIMDEATTGMDAAVRKEIYKIILKDYIENPRSILISSHHLEELEDILEDILLLKDGTKCLHMPVVDLKEYAIGFSGKESAVRALIKDRNVLYEESFGKDSIYLVVETRNFQEDLRAAKAVNIDAKSVSTNDLCIYLTNPRERGINYVFSKE
jgi:ABC-2 type transport system ATP-binding protein